MERDIEAIVTAAAKAPPQVGAKMTPDPIKKQRLRLARIEAHQFAGLHAPQSLENFVFEPTKDITLLEGWNGSGKTSFLNAMIWCLTGQLLRPQRKPEQADTEFECRIERDVSDAHLVTMHRLTPVSPLPDARRHLPDAAQQRLPIDTWVELLFVDENGLPLPPIRRAQARNSRGTISETAPDLSILGIDPIAARMGTTMPGLIPFIQVGSTSELGHAAAQLTGLAELVDLARHATKVSQRLQGELPKARQSEIEKHDNAFREAREDLRNLLGDSPDITPGTVLPEPSEDAHIEDTLTALNGHFESCKTKILQAARVVLGSAFDPGDRVKREDLEKNIGPALVQLQQLGQLASASRLGGIGALTDQHLAVARSLATEAHEQAATLADLAATPSLARRKQLYARVSSWMKEQNRTDVSLCVVCGSSLEHAIDPETGRPVQDHLCEALRGDTDLIGRTVRGWADSWKGKLAQELPQALRGELEEDLPDTPASLMRRAICVELFDTLPFKGTLNSLKNDVARVFESAVTSLTPFNDPARTPFPSAIGEAARDLESKLWRLDRAIAFAKWRQTNRESVKRLYRAVLVGTAETKDAIDADTPLQAKLMALDATVKNATPVTRALELVGRMTHTLASRREKEKRISEYGRVAVAVNELVGLGELAELQVAALRGVLQDRAVHWRDRFYHNAYAFSGHALVGTEMDSKGTLGILVGSGATTAPAQHVSNSSALRASLMGFFMAFWEHVLNSRGGLALLLLDDPQELLDDDNRDRLAHALPDFVSSGAQLFVTTHDRLFARKAVQEAGKEQLEHRSVHPVNQGRNTIETAPAIELLDQKRADFEKHADDASHAQEYASEARVFIEARLADLFDDPAYPAYSAPSKAPTLSDHLCRLRGLVTTPPNDLFKSAPVVDFCRDTALAEGAPCLALLNKAHHHKAAITYNDVHLVRDDLKRLRGAAEALHGEFRRWRWREPEPERMVTTSSLQPGLHPEFDVPVYPDLAAFTQQAPSDGGQGGEIERFSSTWFDNKAFFYLKNENLGFAAPSGSLAVVECDSRPGNDRNLVIALRNGRTYARRLLRPRGSSSVISLAAETPDPRKSPPTLVTDPSEAQIYRIVGALFAELVPPREKEEAVQIDNASLLAGIVTAHRVRDDSALPLALPGQLVLGGPCIQPSEFDAYEGKLVALMLTDSTAIFKRVGRKLPGELAWLRHFESIGGLGASYVAATEALERELSGMPVIACARQVLGVLYET